MPTLTLSNAEFIEGNSGFSRVTFRATLDEAPNVPATFRWFTQEDSATAGDFDAASGTVTFQAGVVEQDITIILRSDGVVEGNESFQIVAYDPRGLDFPQQAAAMVATGTILDDDDGIPDQPAADAGDARLIFGPEAEGGPFPTMTAHETSVIEGNGGFKRQFVLVTLDRPATTAASVDYYTAQGTAANSQGDFDGASGTVNFVAGQRSAALQIVTRTDVLPEEDETFGLIFHNPRSLTIAEGGQALSAGLELVDDDSGRSDLGSGIGDAGTPIFGPEKVDSLPTVRIEGADVIEGDGGFQRVSLLVTLDEATTAPISFDYATQDLTASVANGDYDRAFGTVTLTAGQQSARIEFIVRGDQAIEGDEAFQVLFSGIDDARFEGGAAALETEIGILGDDSGPVSRSAGPTGPASAIESPVSTAPIVPVVQVHDATMIEGDRGFVTMQFLVTLDRPAPAPVTFDYVTLDGSASRNEDFDLGTRSVTIAAGEQSGVISVNLRSDTAREDDESFDLFVYNARNANFAGNTIGQVARGTLLDNDRGEVSDEAGRGKPAPGVLGPEPDDDFVRIAPVAISMREFDSGSQTYSVPVLLSEPARSDVSLAWRTVSTESATAGEDYQDQNGTLTIRAGSGAGLISVRVFGDTDIEGDETFALEISQVSGAVLANGENSLRTVLRIAGDDGGGTPPTNPDFELSLGASNENDRLLGSGASDVISAGGGRDTVDGLAGDDLINGDGGNDILRGNDGDDTLAGGSGDDTLQGGAGNDELVGGAGSDRMEGGLGNDTYSVDDRGDVIRDSGGTDSVRTTVNFNIRNTGVEEVAAQGTGDIRIVGDRTDTRIVGNDGDNILVGGGGEDTLTGGAGADSFAFLRGTGPSNATITDFGPGDKLALDDQFFGMGNGRILPRELSRAEVRELLREGLADFNTRTLELSVDTDGPGGDGGLEVIATFTRASVRELGVDDVLIF
ncbi:Calx-beta domain-containing protein [Jannaschia formosa]|uniref:Calx-beta domain-containing protein n=1 Tax=Jannaschia formosa TaxID=2259592 RepID=UPI000E1B9C89|nr:Calx-beta domain-containing protein [Jannaschia formosa]TFL16859.1 hypothetical protein DR046_17790 [Jannaschia formosa]